MSVAITVVNAKQVTDRLEKLDDVIAVEIKKAVQKAALMVEGAAKVKIQRGAKTGQVYAGANGRLHQASAPGEAPATNTGRLVGSITHNIKDSGLTAIVGSDVEYAIHLEFGTRNMGARPFLQPSVEENRQKIEKMFADAIKKGMKNKGTTK